VPDATGLELLAQQLREEVDPDAIFDTSYYRDRATLIANPKQIKAVIKHLMDQGYSFVASVHGVDYYPDEPRLGVLYEMLDMSKVDRISVKARVHTEAPHLDSIVDLFPGANYPEREVYDMFGVTFDGHPDMRRILMPEDYEGHPQRRDFPVGGEPVLFTYNEEQSYGKWQ
jgi:NADH-quinone oxidoreductase subunit C